MPTLSNVAGIIPSLATAGGIDVARKGLPIQNSYGEYEAAPEVIIHIEPVVVHNLSGRDLDQLPEANRNRETIEVYTRVRLFVSDDGQDADIVIYRARRFKAIQAMDYELQGGVYITICSMEDKQTP